MSVPKAASALVSPGGMIRERRVSTGYASNVYEGKAAQMLQVVAYLRERGFIPPELVENEVSWFYGNLGIDDMYFMLEPPETIASHILALYGSKILAYTRSDKNLEVHLERETEDEAVFIHTSTPGLSNLTGPQPEVKLDNRYLDGSHPEKAYRLESYRSSGTVSSEDNTQLRCYFIKRCDFGPHPIPKAGSPDFLDIRKVSDRTFLEKATENTLEVYESVMRSVLDRTGPVIELFDMPHSREKRLVIGYRQRSTQAFVSAMSDLYHFYDLYSTRKYVEQFSNGVTILCLYLNQLVKPVNPASGTGSEASGSGARGPLLPIDETIYQIMREASLIYCLPKTPLQTFFQTKSLSVQEAVYGYVGWIFSQHFLNRLGTEYVTLRGALDSSNPSHADILNQMKKRLRSETFTRDYVLDIIKSYPELLKLLYVNFAMTHYVTSETQAGSSGGPTLSYQRIQTDLPLSEDELREKIRETTGNAHEQMVFDSFLTFNNAVLKTNFYQPTKVALSFRLSTDFLRPIEYPIRPYGLVLVIGAEFRGFHLRFRDVARGGIRIIRSRNREAYSINQRSLFDENYALAATQQRKNKDIPEGGSKGTILLDVDRQDRPRQAFEKYIDSILDLLIEGKTPGVKEKIVDLYGKEEILFLGPDEGTADYMDWASQHARRRGASFWKAFTTGKSQSLGGIPHDLYGMTTRSVHQYVLGIYRKLGLDESQCTKLQTGGPDGDLGSNEIKISHDKTVAIVDGSGVLHDPNGLDRKELSRLAASRLMIAHFDPSLLGPGGFKVLVDERDITLPSSEVIPDGLSFRNAFHLLPHSSAQVFVPCGGRPESVDLSNVSQLLDPEGQPRFKYIVEGANLFFTQEARIRLESAGVVIFKDASANKGGVTSSSLEVLAALAFNDAEFEEHMQLHEGKPIPDFYNRYISAVHGIIEQNARLEFECIWALSQKSDTPKSVLSDELSFAIVRLNEELQHTSLWDNVALRRVILQEALPNVLVDQIGLDTILQRVPEPYVRATFGAYLASRFVYKYGTSPSQFAFFEFMTPYFDLVGGMN